VIKQTFLAVAVGAALGATGANAATVAPATTNGTNDFTIEASENVAQFAVPDITVTMAAEYQIDDEVTFTYNAAITGDFATTLEVTAPTGVDPYNMTFGLLSETRGTDSTSVTYRVTEITSSASASVTTVGGSYTLVAASGSDLTVTGVRGRASSLDVDYVAKTQNLAGAVVDIDAGDTDGLITRTAQYSVAGKSGFSKTIDSEVGSSGSYVAANAAGSLDDDNVSRLSLASRSLFTDGTATDLATVQLRDDDDGTPSRFAMTTQVVATLSGDFTFLSDTPATAAAALSATMDGNAATTAVHTDTNVTFTWSGGTATAPLDVGDIVFSFNNTLNGLAAMDPGSFSVDIDVSYLGLATTYVAETGNTGHAGAGAGYSNDGIALGSWDYDTTNVNVYAVPYGPAAEMFIWVTSTTSNDTPYMVRATGADDTGTIVTETVATGVMAPNAITRLSGDILTGLAATDIANGRVTLSIEMAAEQCDMVVYAGYKQTVADDRLALETSQSIQGIHNGGVSGQIDDACALGYATGPSD
jgi:hypothetical protein